MKPIARIALFPLLIRHRQSSPSGLLASLSRGRSSFRSESANLDLIRAFAVMCVFVAHLHGVVTGRGTELEWHFAQMGVLTFFVHTSMVLMLSLERSSLRESISFREFYIKRFFRLYPLSGFCVTCAFVLHASPAQPVRFWSVREYLCNLALINNLTYTDIMVGGLWTLPLEVQMYILLPILFLLLRRRPLRFLIPLWGVSVLAAIASEYVSGRLNVLVYAPCFIGGVIAWRLSLSMKRRIAGNLWVFGFATVWPAFLLASRHYDIYYRWLYCLLLGLAIPMFKEVSWKPLVAVTHVVAKYSYGIYLSHIAVMLFSFHLPVPTLARWLVFVVLAILCPVAMFRLIEDPGVQLGKRLTARYFKVKAGSAAPLTASQHMPESA